MSVIDEHFESTAEEVESLTNHEEQCVIYGLQKNRNQ